MFSIAGCSFALVIWKKRTMSVNDEKKICLKSDVVCTLFD